MKKQVCENSHEKSCDTKSPIEILRKKKTAHTNHT